MGFSPQLCEIPCSGNPVRGRTVKSTLLGSYHFGEILGDGSYHYPCGIFLYIMHVHLEATHELELGSILVKTYLPDFECSSGPKGLM